MTPLELATELFGPDPPWPTPSVGDGPGPFDISNVGAWGLMLDFARQANRPEGAAHVLRRPADG